MPSSTPAEGDLVSVPRAARLAGLSERQAWRLVASGRLPSVLVDSHRRVKRADVAVAKKPLTHGEKSTDIGWKCQSTSRDAEIVTEILIELRPVVEKLVQKHLEK